MRPEWTDRLRLWTDALRRDLYEPLGEIALEGYTTYELLDPAEAAKGSFSPMPVGTPWGRTWEYCWMRGTITVDERAKGQRVVMDLNQGGEATLFVNGQAFGTRRAEWVREPHHYICDQVLSMEGKPGETFSLLMEAYGGHDFPEHPSGGCTTGPIRGETGEFDPRPENETRHVIGKSTWGIWHEDAYQLWLDVTTLTDAFSVIDNDSLRAARIEEALEKFTLTVDFEQPRAARLADYRRAREVIRPAMEAANGSTMPRFSAIGNAHLDLSWLWPYKETRRKVARTFAQQVRLMDMYPDYKFLQSQPESYLICKEEYPELYERIKEKVKAGQWIADGSMWVEPDTNMTGGEAMIRQLMYGKKFYKDEFGVDTRLLWLPDTFGYSAVLPQILRGCGVDSLTTQKIFWTYNGSDKFPYHYFTWQGMDGSEVTAFLHMDYTSRTDAATVSKRWSERVQRRDLDRFLLPFGYGDGGGGPTRDHIEFVLREKDFEGIPKVEFEAPQQFFEECAEEGAPKNRYVGELYFQCHRGTYTSQAAMKKGNRKAELALRAAEMLSTMAGTAASEKEEMWKNWRLVLLNQFHDILPGSSIGRVYQEASERYAKVMAAAGAVIGRATAALTKGTEGRSYFNALSWDRTEVVENAEGEGIVRMPAFGAASAVDHTVPAQPVTVRAEGDSFVLANRYMTAVIDSMGRLVSLKDAAGRERISAPANVLHMYKDVPRKFDAWDIDSMYDQEPVALEGAVSVSVAKASPFKCVLHVERAFAGSRMSQNIVLTSEAVRLDFETEVDWQERHRLLKVAFPTGIHAEEGLNEIQFGYLKRPTHRSRPYDADRFEVCNHRWTALCDEGRGAAVLNDCKYGVSMLGDEIALTLLKSGASPDLEADKGIHTFTYSYTFWDGAFAGCDVVRQGWQLNVPVIETEGILPEAAGIAVSVPNVIADTMKTAEDGSGDVILRLYECKHASCTAKVQVNGRRAWVCDMLENKVEEVEVKDGWVEMPFRGFEIKTLRVEK